MNIDDLTIGQAKELAAMFGGCSSKSTLEDPHLGKKCIIRTYASGVHFGVVAGRNGREVMLTYSRRLWRWDVTSHGISLSEVANHGTTGGESKVCEMVPVITILDALEIIPCSQESIAVIEGMEVYKK